MPHIDVAERPGVGLDGHPRSTEDRVVIGPDIVVVLDGATEQREGLPSGGWYSQHLAERIERRVRERPGDDLADVLAAAISDVASGQRLTPGRSPSSTVAMLRWTSEYVDALVLADSPVVVFTPAGPDVLEDRRLDRLRAAGALRSRADVDRLRNTESGFWVAEAVPTASAQARRRRWPRAEVEAAVLATDGVSIGVDTYGVLDWPTVLRLARERGAEAVLDTVRAAERDDAGRQRWPRPKQHDDQALVLIDFSHNQGTIRVHP